MEKPRLRFTLLGKFQYAIGEGERQALESHVTRAIVAYMAFSGVKCDREGIKKNCWEDEPSDETFTRQLNYVKHNLFVKNMLNIEDYVVTKKDSYSLKPGTYGTDLQDFLTHYDAAEKTAGEEHYRLMAKANSYYNGDLLKDVKGKWTIQRAELKVKAKRAKEAAERYAAPKGEAECLSQSHADCIEEETSTVKETAPSRVGPQLPRFASRVRNAGDIQRRRGDLQYRRGDLQYKWVVASLLAVVLLMGLLIHFQHDTATLGDGSDSIHPVPRPVVFDSSDWRPGSEPLQIGVTPEKGFTKVYFFHLKKPVSIPAGATKLYASIQCEDKAHIVQADLVEPEGNTEDAAAYQTRRQWEWKLRQDGRNGSNKTTVEMVVWLGVNPSDLASPRFEGTYWFDSPPKEN